MRSDLVPGATFPDYELPDHTDVPRRLSDLQGDDPLVLTLARGHYCPKEHQQHLELAAAWPKFAVAYTQVATIATDPHHTLQEFRASVGAQWTFRERPDDPAHDRAQAGAGHPHHLQRLLVLGPSVGRRPLTCAR
jgi:peroxiredoxin